MRSIFWRQLIRLKESCISSIEKRDMTPKILDISKRFLRMIWRRSKCFKLLRHLIWSCSVKDSTSTFWPMGRPVQARLTRASLHLWLGASSPAQPWMKDTVYSQDWLIKCTKLPSLKMPRWLCSSVRITCQVLDQPSETWSPTSKSGFTPKPTSSMVSTNTLLQIRNSWWSCAPLLSKKERQEPLVWTTRPVEVTCSSNSKCTRSRETSFISTASSVWIWRVPKDWAKPVLIPRRWPTWKASWSTFSSLNSQESSPILKIKRLLQAETLSQRDALGKLLILPRWWNQLSTVPLSPSSLFAVRKPTTTQAKPSPPLTLEKTPTVSKWTSGSHQL